MIKQILAVSALGAIAIFAQSTTPTERTRPTAEPMTEQRVARLTTLLGLSASQQTQIRTVLLDEFNASSALRSTAQTAHTNLKSAIDSRAGDGQIDAAASQIGLVQGQIAAIHAKAQVRLLNVLTAEQQAKLEALPEGRGGGRGPGGMPGSGSGPMRGRGRF